MNRMLNEVRNGTLMPTLLLLFLPIIACDSSSKSSVESTPTSENSAIQDAIISHVRDVKHIAVDQMTATIEDVVIKGDKATCKATFLSKKIKLPPLSYEYELTKTAGIWHVESSKPVSKHPGDD